MELGDYVQRLYGKTDFPSCPFTEKEISELKKTGELLIYLPANLTAEELCSLFEIKANLNFDNEKMVRSIMTNENQWFITSADKTPELLNKSARTSQRQYEDEGLYGMDFRRYLAFAATFKDRFGKLPDVTYWTFLLSGSYDRSGVSIVGFDSNGILSHHGWMRDFKAKFCGSRYVVLPPRVEINSETEKLMRAYRGSNSRDGKEAGVD